MVNIVAHLTFEEDTHTHYIYIYIYIYIWCAGCNIYGVLDVITILILSVAILEETCR